MSRTFLRSARIRLDAASPVSAPCSFSMVSQASSPSSFTMAALPAILSSWSCCKMAPSRCRSSSRSMSRTFLRSARIRLDVASPVASPVVVSGGAGVFEAGATRLAASARCSAL